MIDFTVDWLCNSLPIHRIGQHYHAVCVEIAPTDRHGDQSYAQDWTLQVARRRLLNRSRVRAQDCEGRCDSQGAIVVSMYRQIVCPLSITPQWLGDCREHTPERSNVTALENLRRPRRCGRSIRLHR